MHNASRIKPTLVTVTNIASPLPHINEKTTRYDNFGRDITLLFALDFETLPWALLLHLNRKLERRQTVPDHGKRQQGTKAAIDTKLPRVLPRVARPNACIVICKANLPLDGQGPAWR